MKLAIMQPYLFPYIGYFQLIQSVDVFVIYDDVNFIKRGWINRNRILINSEEYLFTLPLIKASQNKKINEIYINDPVNNKKNLLKLIEYGYSKAPYFNQVFYLIEEIFLTKEDNLSGFIKLSLEKISYFLEIRTKFLVSSSIDKDINLKGQYKILDICKCLKADEYINAIGGIELYDKELFRKNKIHLSFIKSMELTYDQGGGSFIPWLSIIDMLMFVPKKEIQAMLNQYELI
ncbi:WbqC family protein [Paenibacillus oleatilyticus]|uniref:WbqC family protein n=1 Tax=Paenibacillus oleatilyticus TaxID=2594886 RepID=UPI001C1F6AB6|nr:WbqC family protein [Paenibacillus oleatilyticus]MBU7317611.1 WbqC family protein [Paenibacillus oleatilyticus]